MFEIDSLLHSEKKRASFSPAFTLVELLIVIVVIGVLAAISAVAYSGITNRTYNVVVEQDLAQFSKRMEMVRAELGHYPRGYSEFPADLKISKSAYLTRANNVYYITNIADDTYALGVRSKADRGYILTNSGLTKDAGGVYGAQTAATVGLAWYDGSIAASFGAQGHTYTSATDTSAWRTTWNYTK